MGPTYGRGRRSIGGAGGFSLVIVILSVLVASGKEKLVFLTRQLICTALRLRNAPKAFILSFLEADLLSGSRSTASN